MPKLSGLTRDKDEKRAAAVAYRLLERDAALSVGDALSGNMLIQGDNLEALKSLLTIVAAIPIRKRSAGSRSVPFRRLWGGHPTTGESSWPKRTTK